MKTNATILSNSNKVGFWAAITVGALFVLYTVCFIAILAGSPMFIWTDMPAFLIYNRTYDQTMKYVSYAGMMLLGIAYVVMAECTYNAVPIERKLFARLGVTFGTLFALSSGMNYFVQLVTVRLTLKNGVTTGMEQFIMGNPISAMAAINMLGWTFLLGLSTLCLSMAQKGLNQAKPACICLTATAAVCTAGGLGFVMDNKLIVGICMYPLLGGALIATAVTMARLFRKHDSNSQKV